MTVLTSRVTRGLWYLASSASGLLVARRRRDIINPITLLGRGGRRRRLGGLRPLNTIFGAAHAPLFDAAGVEGAANDVVTHTGQIFHAAAAHQHDGVLLQVVAFVGDVGNDFETVREPDFGDFAHRGVRLLGRAGHDLEADAAAERRILQSRRLRLASNFSASLTDELIDGRHCCFSASPAVSRQLGKRTANPSERNWSCNKYLEHFSRLTPPAAARPPRRVPGRVRPPVRPAD